MTASLKPVEDHAAVASLEITTTRFAAYNEPKGERRSGTYAELVSEFREPLPKDTPKKELPLWSPATFRGDCRSNENVECARLVGFDVDEEPVPNEDELRECARKFRGFFYSTSSHVQVCEDNPKGTARWRLLLLLSRDVNASEYGRVWRAVRRELAFRVGEASKDPSRQWFVPREPCVIGELGGAVVDVDATLASEPEQEETSATLPEEGSTLLSRANIEAAAALLAPAFVHGKRHVMSSAIAGACAWSGVSQADAFDFLCLVAEKGPEGNVEPEKRREWVERTYALAENGAKVAGWPRLRELAGFHADSARDVLFNKPAMRALCARFRRDDEEVNEDETEDEKPEGIGMSWGAWEALPPPIDFLVEGLFPRACVAMLFAHADSLKTWILFSLAIAVAEGKPWLGKYATKQGRVGIVDIETGKTNVTRRLHMLGGGANKNLGAKSFPTLKPNDPDFWKALEGEGLDLVIVDSLRKANPGANENDSAEAIVPLELAAEYSERTGCAVIFIHHAKRGNNDNGGWPEHRGSAAILDQVDCSFAVKKEDVSPTKKRVEIRCDKPGDMRMPDPFAVEVLFEDALCRATVKLAGLDAAVRGADPETKKKQRALDVLRTKGPFKSHDAWLAELRKTGGFSKRELGPISKELVEERTASHLRGEWVADYPSKRCARIVAAVKECEGTKRTVEQLAKTSDVKPWEVTEAAKAGTIKKVGTEARDYWVVGTAAGTGGDSGTAGTAREHRSENAA